MTLDDAQARFAGVCRRHADDKTHTIEQMGPRLALSGIVAANETEASGYAPAEAIALDAHLPILQRSEQRVGRTFGQ